MMVQSNTEQAVLGLRSTTNRVVLDPAVLGRMVDELEAKLEASKGGNTPGVTEDHRFEMADQRDALRKVIAGIAVPVADSEAA